MSITSIFFIFIFLPLTVFGYYLFPKKFKNISLLFASIIFYAWGNLQYLIVLLLSIFFNYFVALEINYYIENSGKTKSKAAFIFGLAFNIFVLGFFKYYGFIVENINNIFATEITIQKLPLPLGISFFTFSVLSYLIDVYQGKSSVQKNIISFALYVSFFPKITSGPIIRYADFAEQLNFNIFDYEIVGEGIKLYIIGLAKKILLADHFSLLYQNLNSLPDSEYTVLSAWLALIAFTLQIYFDFSGYSDMAIGLAKMYGYNLPRNFNYPYVSRSITEFWRRWHITLGSWFREYVYIPLGGNRVGVVRHIRNIMVVWLLTGIWHGAAWNYILWGLFYGLILIFEKYIYGSIISRSKIIAHLYTILIVMLGWLIFTSPSIAAIGIALRRMFGAGNISFANQTFLYYLRSYFFQICIGCLAATPIFNNLQKSILQKRNRTYVLISGFLYFVLFFFSLAFLMNSTYQSFLYVGF